MFRSTFAGLILALFLTTTLVSFPAHAYDVDKGWVGGLFGLAVPNAGSTNSRGAYGLTAGAKLGDEFGVGAYWISSPKNETFGKFNYDMFGIQVSYHYTGEASGVFIGGRVGTSKVETNLASNSPMNLGIVAGGDYKLMPQISIGGEISWMSISSSTLIDSFSTLNFLAALKFWF